MIRLFEEDWIFSGKKAFMPASVRSSKGAPTPGLTPRRALYPTGRTAITAK